MRDSIKFTRFYNDTAFIKLHLVTQFNGFHIRVINILVQVICMSCKKALLVISDKVTTKDIANDGIVSYNFQSTNLANAVRRAFQSLCQKQKYHENQTSYNYIQPHRMTTIPSSTKGVRYINCCSLHLINMFFNIKFN